MGNGKNLDEMKRLIDETIFSDGGELLLNGRGQFVNGNGNFIDQYAILRKINKLIETLERVRSYSLTLQD